MSTEKLIRDGIVDFVFKQRGEVLKTRIASSEELGSFLKHKVVEEAGEVFNSKNKEELAEELADLLEVIKSISEKENIVEQVFSKREAKYLEKGGFDKGLILIGNYKK
jgi:predicted house-cleaning noncanonical NTP pyrophosphatase (MazG superfamily)